MARKNNNKRYKRHSHYDRYHHNFNDDPVDLKPQIKTQIQPAKKRSKHRFVSAEAVYEIAREVFGVGYCPLKEEDGKSETQG